MKKLELFQGIILLFAIFEIINSLFLDNEYYEFYQYNHLDFVVNIQTVKLIIHTLWAIYYFQGFKVFNCEKIYSNLIIIIIVNLLYVCLVYGFIQYEIIGQEKLPYYGELKDKHVDFFSYAYIIVPIWIIGIATAKKIFNIFYKH